MDKDVKISVVIPVYYAEGTLKLLIKGLITNLRILNEPFEIILVEDRSTDNSWAIIRENARKLENVKGLRLSRNFGQHHAITAGLHRAEGEWVIVMDCDLQDKPEELPNLYKKALEGYDVVLAKRVEREDKGRKRWASLLFYRLFSYLTNTRRDPRIGNFGIYHQKVIKAVLELKDNFKAFPFLIKWVGYEQAEIEVQREERKIGKSNYKPGKLLSGALNTFIYFSHKPLFLIMRTGFFLTLISFLSLFIYVFLLILNVYVFNLVHLLMFVLISLSGLILFSMGLIALYIGKIFSEVKNRPVYIIDESTN